MNFLHRAVLSAALAAPSVLFAQSSDLGPLPLRLPSSARALAMGNVAIVGRDDDVLFYNPAQLVAARGMSISSEQFASGARSGAFSAVTRFSTGGIAIGATMAEFNRPVPGYLVSRANFFQPDEEESAASLVVGIGQVFKSVRYGGSVKVIEQQFGAAHGAGWVGDVGLGRDFFGYNFGLAVQNIGATGELDVAPLPGVDDIQRSGNTPLRTTFGVGHGWNTDVFDFTATAAVSALRDGFLVPAGGGEVSYSWLDGYTVVLRGGARRPEHGEGAVTGGLGLVIDRLSIDYAIETLGGSRVAHRFGLRIR
jgi:hypothetical protein